MFRGLRRKPADQDWRLQLNLDEPTDAEAVLGQIRNDPSTNDHHDPGLLGDDVVVTHDGGRLFVYAANKDSLDTARKILESALSDGSPNMPVRVTHWDERLAQWHQVEPPLTPEEEQALSSTAEAKVERSTTNEPVESRTVMAVVGKLIRKQFEQQMISFAQNMGIECTVVEHPHLLSTQIAFTVTGSSSDVAAFARYLKNEARASSRIDPGLIPYGLP